MEDPALGGIQGFLHLQALLVEVITGTASGAQAKHKHCQQEADDATGFYFHHFIKHGHRGATFHFPVGSDFVVFWNDTGNIVDMIIICHGAYYRVFSRKKEFPEVGK